MRRQLLLLLTLLSAASLLALPKFEAGKRYHIVCQLYPQGCVVDGATIGQNTPLYYRTPANRNDESAWIFTAEMGNYFSIKNAKTGQYVTYDGVRQDSPQLRRYVIMTDELNGYNSYWYLDKQDDGSYSIHNVEQWDHIWDVRSGSYCVGTYSNGGNPNQNQRFYFTDETGNRIAEKQPNDIGNGEFLVSSWLKATAESSDGWYYDHSSWGDPGFGSYYNDEEGAFIESPFLEHWQSHGSGGLPDDRIYQTLKYLPAGEYTVCADVIAVLQNNNVHDYGTPATGVYLFANDQQTACSTGSELPIPYSVDVTIGQNGQLTLGLFNENTTANWIAFDNVNLIFHGTEEEMIEGEKNKIREELGEYLSASEIEALINRAGNDFYALEEVRTAVYVSDLDPLAQAVKNISIDGRALIYVESLDLYLCTLPLENFNTTYTARIEYTPRDGCSNLRISNREVIPGQDFTFGIVVGSKTYMMNIKNADGKNITKPLAFTSLPVVRITGSFNDYYSEGSIIVHEPDKGIPSTLRMKAKWRGGITNGSGKHKRNYHVKLLDENGDKLEQKFFGLRNDNSWILESCQVDMSRIRNRVLTDLWNDYSTPPYYIDEEPKARTGTRGRFVELILNDEYRGIYCMTENIDRKQMKLKKYDENDGTIHGQLWKSKDWSYATFMGHYRDNNSYPGHSPSGYNDWNEYWDSFQVKYPDLEDVFPTDWSTLYNAVDFVCTSNNNEFREHIAEYFDLPVVIDYYILMETILSTDNHGKNLFYATYDTRQSPLLTLAVWDMDATCGQRWDDSYWHQSFLGPEQDYTQFIIRYEHGDFNLFRRLRLTDAEDFNMQVRLRYRDLRQGPLSTESILKRFHTQIDEFNTCGAAKRESDRWSGDTDIARHTLDFDEEMEYIDDWFTRRMNYLDTERFDIASLPSDITETLNSKPQTTNLVYDLQGQRVGTFSQFDRLPAGVYIYNGRKLVKK